MTTDVRLLHEIIIVTVKFLYISLRIIISIAIIKIFSVGPWCRHRVLRWLAPRFEPGNVLVEHPLIFLLEAFKCLICGEDFSCTLTYIAHAVYGAEIWVTKSPINLRLNLFIIDFRSVIIRLWRTNRTFFEIWSLISSLIVPFLQMLVLYGIQGSATNVERFVETSIWISSALNFPHLLSQKCDTIE